MRAINGTAVSAASSTPTMERNASAQRTDQQAHITGMTDHAVETCRHQRMVGLDGDQATEAPPQYEHRPHAHDDAADIDGGPNPSQRLAVQRPKADAVGVGWQPRKQQPDHGERAEHPAIAAILADAGTEIAAAEQRHDRRHNRYQRQHDQRRVRNKCGQPADPVYRKSQIDNRAGDCGKQHPRRQVHGHPDLSMTVARLRRLPQSRAHE
jgi:hypothetical protein